MLVGGEVAQFGQGAQAGEDAGGPGIELVGVRTLQGVLVLGLADAAADANVLTGGEEDLDAFEAGHLGAQAGDDLLGGDLAVFPGLQRDEEAGIVRGLAELAGADGG